MVMNQKRWLFFFLRKNQILTMFKKGKSDIMGRYSQKINIIINRTYIFFETALFGTFVEYKMV